MVIKTISFEVHDVGKLVKKSKKKYVWKFAIDGVGYRVELFASSLSGKKKVLLNGDEIFSVKKKLGHDFSFPFQIDVNMCNINQKGDTYELKINNTTFDGIINTQNASKTNLQPTYNHQSNKPVPQEAGISRNTKLLLELDAEANANKPGENRPDFSSALAQLKGERKALQVDNKNAHPPATQTQVTSTKNSKPATQAKKNDPMDLWDIDFTQQNTQKTTTTTTTTQQNNWNNNNSNQGFNNFNFNTQPANTQNKKDDFADFGSFGNFNQTQTNTTTTSSNNNLANFNNFGNAGKNDDFFVPQQGQTVNNNNINNQDFFVPGSNNNGNGKQKEKEKSDKSSSSFFGKKKDKEKETKKKDQQNFNVPPQNHQQQQQPQSMNFDAYNNNTNSNNNQNYSYNSQQQVKTEPGKVPDSKPISAYTKNLSALVGIDRSKLAGISGTTKKSRAEASSKNDLDEDNNENMPNNANAGSGDYNNNNNYNNNSDNNYNNNYGGSGYGGGYNNANTNQNYY